MAEVPQHVGNPGSITRTTLSLLISRRLQWHNPEETKVLKALLVKLDTPGIVIPDVLGFNDQEVHALLHVLITAIDGSYPYHCPAGI